MSLHRISFYSYNSLLSQKIRCLTVCTVRYLVFGCTKINQIAWAWIMLTPNATAVGFTTQPVGRGIRVFARERLRFFAIACDSYSGALSFEECSRSWQFFLAQVPQYMRGAWPRVASHEERSRKLSMLCQKAPGKQGLLAHPYLHASSQRGCILELFSSRQEWLKSLFSGKLWKQNYRGYDCKYKHMPKNTHR